MAEYDCRKCKSHCAWKGSDGPDHGKCLVGYTPMTNADSIRAMSDEELAEWLDNIDTAFEPETIVSRHGWLDWLQQEVSE